MQLIPPQVRHFAGKLTAFAESVGISLTDEQSLDITGHLWSDEFHLAIKGRAQDWHCVLWNRHAASTGERYNLAASEAAALAAVRAHADSEGHDIDNVERTDEGLTIWAQEDVYARVNRVEFVEPEARTRQRVATLLAPLKTWDDQGLLRALATLPAWKVEPYNPSPLWFDGHVWEREPRRGEWLPPLSSLSQNLNPDERLGASTQNLLPMWVTPNSLAKLLQQLLAQHAPTQRVALATCQEGLAMVLGVQSWQVLVARFRTCITPQIVEQLPDDDSVPPIRIWRGPVELLAGVYDFAVQRKLSGASPLYVQAHWVFEYRMALTYRLASREDLLHDVSDTAGVHPKDIDGPSREQSLAEQRWDAIELACRVKAGEWADPGFTHDILCPEGDAVGAAQAELAEIA